MTVVHLISGLRGGGAEKFLLAMCKEAQKTGHVNMVVVQMSSADQIGYLFEHARVQVHQLHLNSTAGLPRALKYFNHVIRRHGQDKLVVHAHMFHACIFAVLYKISYRNLPVVFTLQNTVVKEWSRRLMLFVTKAWRNADVVFPGQQIKWYQRKDAVAIPNAIDSRRFDPGIRQTPEQFDTMDQQPPQPFDPADRQLPEPFTALFAGRLEEQKNPLYLVELMKTVQSNQPWRIRVFGDGPLKSFLAERIKEEGLQDRFDLAGYSEDMPAEMQKAHCLLLPSWYEGMPLVMLEAGAAGLPVIATATGNIVTVMDDTTGYVGPLTEFPDMLIAVMTNYSEARQRAERFRMRVTERYDLSAVLSAHFSLYSRQLA